MKQQILTLLLALCALCSQAQGGEPRVPTPHKPLPAAWERSLQWNRLRPQPADSDPQVVRSRKAADASQRARYVGDGTTLCAGLLSSRQWGAPGFCSLTAAKGFEVSQQQINQDINTSRALYAKGKFYVWQVDEFWGEVWYVCSRVYNADDWSYETALEPAYEYSNIPVGATLTYDATTDRVYAITFNQDGSGTALSVMNMADASFTAVSALSTYFITLACSPEGVLYALDEQGNLHTIDKTNGTTQLVGATGLTPRYAQTMAFDGQTGKLYWAYSGVNDAALFEVNPSSARAYKIDDMPGGEQLAGLFVKSTPVPDAAPAPVAGLTFAPEAAGALTGSLRCTAPTLTAGGTALTGDVTINIYCGDETLATTTVAPGAAVDVPQCSFEANRLYTLYATAGNAAGVSAKSSITLFIGQDAPGAPRNVSLMLDGRQARLTWEAPTTGAWDGAFTPEGISYQVVRYADDDQGTLVATTESTSFSETLPEAAALYRYAVTPMQQGEAGLTAMSNAVYAIGTFELPFYDNFSDGERSQQIYTFIDVDADRTADNKNAWFWKADEKLMQYCADGVHVGNDWLISPAIHLDGTHRYLLQYSLNMGAPANLRVTLGTSPDPKDHTVVLADHQGINEAWQHLYSAEAFTVPAEGNYYLGFYVYSGTDGFYLNLFEINLTEGGSTIVPDSVKNLTVTPDAKGKKEVKITFDAPKVLANGADLPFYNSLDVLVYRDEELIRTVSAYLGHTYHVVDDVPTTGLHAYRIYAVMDGLEGIEQTREVWVGYDVPCAPEPLEISTSDENTVVNLAWSAPTAGSHDGYFDASQLTYSVWRGRSRSELSPLATGLTALSYRDETAQAFVGEGKQDGIYYAVTADVDDVRSDAIAHYLVVGWPYALPKSESFPNGGFDIEPWSTESVSGEFGFECRRSDKNGGGWPQDYDGGFTKFMSQGWSDYTDSRLKSPLLNLKGSQHPMVSFFMFHWDETGSSAVYDNYATKLRVEISVDGGEFRQIGEDYTAFSKRYGWVEHRISLEEFKDAGCVQIAFRGMTDNDWMYFYIDNIHFEEQPATDLCVADFSGSQSGNVGDALSYYLTFFNRGTKPASGYQVSLFVNDCEAASFESPLLQPGEIADVAVSIPALAPYAGQDVFVHAAISCEGDEQPDNNTSADVTLNIQTPWYPIPQGLTAAETPAGVQLGWQQIDLPTTKTPIVDGAEDYEPFAISGFGDWKTYDGDRHGCGTITNLPDYANRGVDQAWQIWAPGLLAGVDADAFPQLQPRSGSQAFISWYANTYIDWDAPFNDDYLISPQVCGGSPLSFWVRRIHTSVNETFEVLASSTTPDPSAFSKIFGGTATDVWTEVQVSLPADARYFAIRYTGELQDGIMVDDISYIPALFDLKVLGYNVYRDGILLNAAPVAEPSYIDAAVSAGEHAYQVSAVTNFGESAASEPVSLRFTAVQSVQTADASVRVEGQHIVIEAQSSVRAEVVNAQGQTLFAQPFCGSRSIRVAPGVYVVRIDGASHRLLVRQ